MRVSLLIIASRVGFAQAPADFRASFVVRSTPGMGGHVLRSSDFGWAHGAPFIFFVERRPPSEVSCTVQVVPIQVSAPIIGFLDTTLGGLSGSMLLWWSLRVQQVITKLYLSIIYASCQISRQN